MFDKLNRGFPLKPPVSLATGILLTGSGLEIVVFDMIYTKIEMLSQNESSENRTTLTSRVNQPKMHYQLHIKHNTNVNF